jgi:hypothetical protein
MREINKSFVGDQLLNGHLLNAQNNRTLADVFAQNCPSSLILVVRENSFLRGLHDNFDIWVFGEDLLDIPRSERSPALPHAFVLPANTNQVDVLHVLVITN